MPLLPLADATLKTSIDLKANGEVSRMRSHKGNMPSLPQTKYCTLCPAKFTRTTHLNRHLRSHTNERAHRCNICNAEFTRSDLLTRHKRTCGDSSNVNRSRRKSCQACAESKVKCNLQHPCSKCSARGRECIFINDPEASRNRKIAAKKAPRSSLSMSPSEGDYAESPTPMDSSPSSPLSFGSHVSESFSHIVSPVHIPNHLMSNTAYGLPGISNASDCSSGTSSRSSPRLDYFDHRHDMTSNFSTSFDNLELESPLNNPFPTTLDPLLEDPFSSGVSRAPAENDMTAWFEHCAGYGNQDPQAFPQHEQFVTGMTNLNPACSSKHPLSRLHFSTNSPIAGAPYCSSASGNPTTEDLDMYLYLFFTEFNSQIPLFHRAGWKLDHTHPILMRAMQACGAFYSKSSVGMDFAIKTLTTSRDMIMIEFSKPECTLKDHMCLMLAVVLLQSTGLLQPRPEQRGIAKIYHDILVMMVRKTGLIKFVGSWPPPDLSNAEMLENAWKDWARFETFKRALILSYIQDCSFAMFFGTTPSFLPSEFDICLPCDDALWRASSARDWYQTQRTPSPYGLGTSRILGVSFPMALTALKEQTAILTPFTLNPFSAFVLVHSILRDVFLTSHSSGTGHGGLSSPSMVAVGGNPISIQCALHNWHRMWSGSPEAVHSEKYPQNIPFLYNALPFYWLARLAEAAKQSGTLHVRPLCSRADVEERHRTIKERLEQIQTTLRSGTQVSSPSNEMWHNSPSLPVGIPSYSHMS
ncbi:hypothetical protein BJ165DRAFT_1345120 [Panaeolus papilionaceus]|nr:hypothetical protein BJ165DRAFT_1345120 [Panaeolus papilionaceus]